MRFTLDSNILVYALDVDTADKHGVARDLLSKAPSADAILTVQALAEFLAVIRRKYPQYLVEALAQAERWAALFPLASTGWAHVSAAAELSRAHGLQLWDGIIWQAARSMGASVLLSEDLQDGLSLEGMTVIDPFNPANSNRVAQLVAGLSDTR